MPTINEILSRSPSAQYGTMGTGLSVPASTGDTMYDRLYQSNPYRNLTYKKSMWQSVAEALGFRTDYDRWKEDAQVNAAEYDARIAEFMSQNEYNAPEAMANRERQAGMNPDLLGIGDVASAASQAPDPNGMSQNVGDEFSSFGESLAGVISRSLAIYKDFKSIAELDNIIEAGDLDNANKMLSSIDGWLQQQYQESDFLNRSSHLKKSSLIKGNLENELLGDYEGSSAFTLGISKRDWKRWTTLAGNRVDSLMGDSAAFDAFAKAGKSRADATGTKLNPLYTKSDEVDDTLLGVGTLISDKYAETLEDKAKNDAYQEALRTGALENQGMQQDLTGTELAYLQDNEGAVKKASSEIAKWDNDWYQHRLNQRIADMQTEMLNFLKEKAKHSRFANLMLMNWTLDNMVNVGINASANASVGLNLGLGANIANTVSTIFKP